GWPALSATHGPIAREQAVGRLGGPTRGRITMQALCRIARPAIEQSLDCAPSRLDHPGRLEQGGIPIEQSQIGVSSPTIVSCSKELREAKSPATPSLSICEPRVLALRVTDSPLSDPVLATVLRIGST